MVLAPSYSPLISIHPLPIYRDIPSFPSSPCHFPFAYESPLLKPSEWNKQKEAERSAHLEEEDPRMVLIAHCELCDIGIGPGHVYQELYLYPVYDHGVLCIVNGREHFIKKEKVQEQGGLWLLCCGGCARSAKRMLPSSYILCSQVETLAEARAMITARLAWFLLLTMAHYHLPLRSLWGRTTPSLRIPVHQQKHTSFASVGMALIPRTSTPAYAL